MRGQKGKSRARAIRLLSICASRDRLGSEGEIIIMIPTCHHGSSTEFGRRPPQTQSTGMRPAAALRRRAACGNAATGSAIILIFCADPGAGIHIRAGLSLHAIVLPCNPRGRSELESLSKSIHHESSSLYSVSESAVEKCTWNVEDTTF